MKEMEVKNCERCNREIFLTFIDERVFPFEDLQCKRPHTKFRCEVNQIVSERTSQLEFELRQIKEKLNLE